MAAAYIATFAENRNAPAEITLTTRRVLARSRCGSASWTRNTGPRRFTSNDFCQASGVNSPSGCVERVGRVVDDDVDAAEPVDGALDETRAARRGRPCASARRAPRRPSATRCASVSAHASALRLATTTLAPGGHEAFGDRAADAPRPAGDDRDAAAQVEQRSQCGLVHGCSLPGREVNVRRHVDDCDHRFGGRHRPRDARAARTGRPPVIGVDVRDAEVIADLSTADGRATMVDRDARRVRRRARRSRRGRGHDERRARDPGELLRRGRRARRPATRAGQRNRRARRRHQLELDHDDTRAARVDRGRVPRRRRGARAGRSRAPATRTATRLEARARRAGSAARGHRPTGSAPASASTRSARA